MKGRKTDLGLAECAIARSLQVIGDWWSLLIVREALLGKQRFGEFQKGLGLAKNILSSRLKKLVEEGIFKIVADGEAATRHRYVLTDKGERLYVVLVALWQWGERACVERGELELAMVDSRDEAPLAELQVRSHDDRPIGPRDMKLLSTEVSRDVARAAALPSNR